MIEPNIYPAEATGDVLSVSRADAQKYEVYEKWYSNKDGLFTGLGKFTADVKADTSRIQLAHGAARVRSSVENLRNPVHRAVEFHATTILTGTLDDALKVEDEDSEGKDEGGGRAGKLKEALLLIWQWSNLAQRIRVAKRHLARDGQFFWKIVRPEGKDFVYLQVIPAKHVTDYEADERGNVTYARVDVPGSKSEAGQSRKVWATEIWRKGETRKDGEKKPGYALFAETERTTDASVPSEKRVEQASGVKKVELGSEAGYPFDFVPFVVVNAQDTGEKRPEPVYAHGLHLISWVCREATRLSDLFFRFNKAFKVIGGIGNDVHNRPIPPPRPGNVRDLETMRRDQQQDEHTVPFGGSRASILNRDSEDISIEGVAVVGLPGNAQMFDATPNINYEAARVWINDHIREVYEELPELLYYAVESRANQSGTALRVLIAGAISRGEEMQSNLITGLVKADKMALTVAQLADFEGFTEAEIGTYEGDGFDHDIEPPEILPLSNSEVEDVRAKKIANAQALMASRVSPAKAYEIVGLDIGELSPEPEEAGGDDVARAAAALARRSEGDVQ